MERAARNDPEDGADSGAPYDAASWLALSDALAREGRYAEALAACAQSLARAPGTAEILYRRGVLEARLGRLPEAELSYRGALALRPAYPEVLCNLATLRHRQGDAAAALALVEEALKARPDFLPALLNRANLLYQQGELRTAASACRAALQHHPDEPKLMRLLATASRDLGRLDEAESVIGKALALAPGSPDALMTQGIILRDRGAQERALEAFEAALRQRPHFPEALSNSGLLLRELGRVEESIARFDAALALKPDYVDARNNRAGSLLLCGRLREGFEDLEARWARGNAPRKIVDARFPEWQGEPLDGRSILVYDEQGLGDLIHMARYLPLLKDRGASVTFIGRKSMHALLRRLRAAPELLDIGEEAGPHDYQIALMSLPRAFGATLSTLPAEVPYLSAEPERAALWAERIGTAGPRIGLCWQGNMATDSERSLSQEALRAISAVKGLRYFSLMRDTPVPAGLPIESLGGEFDSGASAFLDSAAVIANLDLVVTCDTAIAHLAGALGRPCFVLLKKIPDWRWLLGRSDSPWYPSLRLFRQTQRNDWAPVAAEVAKELGALCRR